MFTERIENWRTRVISQEANHAQSQGALPEAIARAERFSKLNITFGRYEMLIYVALMVTSSPVAAASILIPIAVTHILLDGFNDMRIKYLNRALDEQLRESSGLILSPLGNQTTA